MDLTVGSDLSKHLTKYFTSRAAETDPITALYPAFTVGANDDEFNDNSFSGWTAVNSGSQVPTVTEANHVASIVHPGGGSSAYLWAYMKSYSVQVNDYIEIAFRFASVSQAYNRAGLLMANGVSFGSGAQVIYAPSYYQAMTAFSAYTGYNTDDPGGSNTLQLLNTLGCGVTFLRMKYEGSNHFRAYVSADGVSWVDVSGQQTFTLTPTYIGFFLTPYGGGSPLIMSVHYFKQSA